VPAGGGFNEPLARGRGVGSEPGAMATRGVFGYALPGFNGEDASLLLQRGDARRWIQFDLRSGKRGPVEAYGPMGYHRWGASGSLRNGAHRLSGSFVQRGVGFELASAEQQSASGLSGTLAYRWARGMTRAGLTFARAYDAHESAAPGWVSSRRDADAERIEALLGRDVRGGSIDALVSWERDRVRRDVDPTFDARSDDWWGGVRLVRDLGDGKLRLDLGGGRNGGANRGAFAPSAWYGFDRRDGFGGVFVARKPNPVWSDLESGAAPFLEDRWVYGLEAGTRRAAGLSVRGELLLGRTRDGAVLARLPFEELWLRLGAVREPGWSDFALATARAEWRARSGRIGVEGFGLRRDRSDLQPAVDPTSGFRAWTETGFRLFTGDLGLVLRLDAAGVGARESESVTPTRLPSYVTFGASVQLSLGDALVVIRLRNLEDVAHAEPWIDLNTGREALGPGREFVLALTWKMFD
jgi:hypothetical protein